MHWRRDASPGTSMAHFRGRCDCLQRGSSDRRPHGGAECGSRKVYFPASSIDDNDIVDGYVDYDANAGERVQEETIDLHDARADSKSIS